MLKDEIKAAYTRGKWALVLRGLLGIALGVVILARPLESVAAFALVIAIWALVDGIVNVVHAFDLRAVTSYWWVMLLSGLVSFGFGAAALYYYPGLSLTFAVLWTAWWLMTAGALGIYLAVQERKADVPWGGTMTLGVITLAVGGGVPGNHTRSPDGDAGGLRHCCRHRHAGSGGQDAVASRRREARIRHAIARLTPTRSTSQESDARCNRRVLLLGDAAVLLTITVT